MSDDKKKLKVKQSGIMNIRGKEVATYPAMIDFAHQCGIQSLEVAVHSERGGVRGGIPSLHRGSGRLLG